MYNTQQLIKDYEYLLAKLARIKYIVYNSPHKPQQMKDDKKENCALCKIKDILEEKK